jgi:hypothetical protein
MPPRKATKKTAGGTEDNRLPVIPVTGISAGASGPVNDGAASVIQLLGLLHPAS